MNDPETIDSVTRPMYWSVRRELAENRSIYIAPLVVAALALFGFSLGSFAGIWEKALRLDVTQAASKVAEPYTYVSGLLMATTFIVGVFYSLDALFGERRDRSILFWKSLPVSDRTAVLSKAIVAIVVLPLLTFVITIITQALILLVSSAIVLASGQSVAMLWEKLPLLRMSGVLLHHLVVVHGLWHAPLFAWLLLVSAAVRHLPFIWAILPLVAIQVLEKIAFRTSHFANMLGKRMSGGEIGGAVMKPTAMHMHAGFAEFLIDPAFWIGLVVTALLLAGAVRLRRNRGPI